MEDDYAHPVGQVSKQLVDAHVELANQAEAARQAGDVESADRLDREAKAHLDHANLLDRADTAYAERNKQV